MPKGFFKVAGEIRNRIYELILVHQEWINPWDPDGGPENLDLALLRVSKTVNREASSVFYGENKFDLCTRKLEDLTAFFQQIGTINAGHIRDVCVAFPELDDIESGNVSLREEDHVILTHIQKICPRVSRLTISLWTVTGLDLPVPNWTADDTVRVRPYDKATLSEALALVDTSFREFPSLCDIIAVVEKEGPTELVKAEMRKQGWTVEEIEDTEQDDEFPPDPIDWIGESEESDNGNHSDGTDDEVLEDDLEFDWHREGDMDRSFWSIKDEPDEKVGDFTIPN